MCPANPAFRAGSLPTGRQDGGQYRRDYLTEKPLELLGAVSFVERLRPLGGRASQIFGKKGGIGEPDEALDTAVLGLAHLSLFLGN